MSKRLRVFEDPAVGPAVLSNELSVSVGEELLGLPPKKRDVELAQLRESDRQELRLLT